MAGASIPQGFFGGGMTGGSPIGWSGGQGLGGTQAAVTNPTDPSKLMAYDASTMSTSLTPKAPIPESLGLASGSVGQAGITGDVSSSAKGTLFKPPTPHIPPPTPKVTTPTKTSTTGAGKTTTPPPAATGIQGLQMHGPWEGANTGPLFVNDQWQGGTGTSQPVATPALGTQNNSWYSQFSGPVWTDPKTGFVYSDPQGKNQMFIGGNKATPFQSKTKIGGSYY